MRQPVSPNDAMWLQDTATNLMVINAVVVLDRLDLEALRAAWRERVEDDPRFARLKCRVVRDKAGNHWQVDPDYSLERQIIHAPKDDLATLQHLEDYVGAEASKPLPDDRPRWQFQVVEHFEADASALVIRIHHSIADGMALVGLMFALVEELGEAVPKAGRTPGGGARRSVLAQALAMPLQAPGILLSRLLWRPDRHALHGARLSGEKRVAWTGPLDLAVVKAAKDRLGATVNDVLMGSVSGAFTSYLRTHANHRLEKLRLSMPVNVRPAHERPALDNRFAAVPLELPAGDLPLEAIIHLVKARMDALKGSAAPGVIYGLQRALLSFLPEGASRGLIDFLANKCTAVVTNVPGPTRQIAIAGRKVRTLLFWVPQRADIGVGISILSFAGRVQVGVLTDASVLEDPNRLVAAFEEQFEVLKGLG